MKILSVTDANKACIRYTRTIREEEQVLSANFVISVTIKNDKGYIMKRIINIRNKYKE